MKFNGLIVAAATVALPAAAAAAPSPLAVSYNVGATTDYVFRGVSQSRGEPAVFAGVDAVRGQAYGGLWASNVDFSAFGDRSTSVEIDAYGGWRPTIEGFGLDVGLLYTGYLDQPRPGPRLDYWEASVAASKSLGPITVGGSLFYSPAFIDTRRGAWYLEAAAAYRISDRVSVSGALGRQSLQSSSDDYTTWNAGLVWSLKPGLSLDLRYYGTDRRELDDPFHARGVASLKAAF